MADIDEKVRRDDEPGKAQAARQAIAVQVTPLIVLPTNEVVCEITGKPSGLVQNGIIKLPGGQYTISFQLQPGDVPNLEFDRADPLWCSRTSCPMAASNDPQLSARSCGALTLDVSADPTPPKNAVFYRLNFKLNGAPGYYCDPIIINH